MTKVALPLALMRVATTCFLLIKRDTPLIHHLPTLRLQLFFPPFGNRDSIYFDITHYLEGDLLLGLADTLRFRQKFFNYYAYDDGTAEFGYGLTPTGAQLAYKFTLSRRDTLRAIQMYFNKTLTGANERYFHLAVWGDLNGIPPATCFTLKRTKNQYSATNSLNFKLTTLMSLFLYKARFTSDGFSKQAIT